MKRNSQAEPSIINHHHKLGKLNWILFLANCWLCSYPTATFFFFIFINKKHTEKTKQTHKEKKKFTTHRAHWLTKVNELKCNRRLNYAPYLYESSCKNGNDVKGLWPQQLMCAVCVACHDTDRQYHTTCKSTGRRLKQVKWRRLNTMRKERLLLPVAPTFVDSSTKQQHLNSNDFNWIWLCESAYDLWALSKFKKFFVFKDKSDGYYA